MKQELLSESEETLKQIKTKGIGRYITTQVIATTIPVYLAVKFNWLPAKILVGFQVPGLLIYTIVSASVFQSFKKYGIKTADIKDCFKALISKYGLYFFISSISSTLLLMSGWYFTGITFLLASCCCFYLNINRKSLEEVKRILRS